MKISPCGLIKNTLHFHNSVFVFRLRARTHVLVPENTVLIKKRLAKVTVECVHYVLMLPVPDSSHKQETVYRGFSCGFLWLLKVTVWSVGLPQIRP